MNAPTKEQLREIVRLHGKWLRGEAGGARADLSGAVLRGAVLRGAVLRGAVLRGAVLRGAVLRGADLSGADLSGAVLRGADLSGADLSGAVLGGAVLRGAVLRGAVLSDDTVLPDGVVWKQYLSDVVPALLQSGGRALAEVATAEAWACHSWQNCPMAEAFRVHALSDVPALYRAQANLFVQLFDAHLIPLPAMVATDG